MSDEAGSAETSTGASLWAKIVSIVRSWDEALSRTPADDLMDRIAALERRIENLEVRRAPARQRLP
ncbi:polyhydroxyalkanoate synthesis regulator phasin [Brevundimonas vesicularis]|nr:polyhydroxyalkanoate synthesis regulator phasin [Brevundimonas vesicularis]